MEEFDLLASALPWRMEEFDLKAASLPQADIIVELLVLYRVLGLQDRK